MEMKGFDMKSFWAITMVWASLAAADPTFRTCEPITVDLCKNIGYNVTSMPNLAKHTMQADAGSTMQTFTPLLQYGCSNQLLVFLCSVYVPLCNDKVPSPIGPCKNLCDSVFTRCYPILKGFGFPWPNELNCSQFPLENNHEHMCMEPEDSTPGNVSGMPIEPLNPIFNPDLICQKYSKSTNYIYLSRSGRCAQYCNAETLYDASDKNLAEVWLCIWATLCFLSTMIAVLTFVVGAGSGSNSNSNSASSRFRYPARPLVFMALCHNLTAVGWGVRGVAGYSAVACFYDAQVPMKIILSQDGLANPNCAVVFLLLYYFGMAASVWWVVLTGSWRARVVRRATGATGGRRGPSLQLAAWGLPALQTVAVLVMRDVDADELTGTCFVGNQSTKSLMALVIVPQLIYLSVGSLLLFLGFRTLLKTPTPAVIPALPQPNGPHNPHLRKDPAEEINLLRLGIFAVIYIVPMSFVIASWMYEYFLRDSWLAAVKPSATPSIAPKPSLWVFLLRILMLQILGVLTSFWVLSRKALQAWKTVFGRMGPSTYKPAPFKTIQQPIPIHYYATPQIHTVPKRNHSHNKYPTHSHGSHRKPRLHHAHQLPLPGGETML